MLPDTSLQSGFNLHIRETRTLKDMQSYPDIQTSNNFKIIESDALWEVW